MRTPRRLRQLAALSATVLLAVQLPSSAADGPWPGLPRHTGVGGIWVGAAQTGMAETAKAKQWVRAPWQVAAVWILAKGTSYPPDHQFITTVDTTNSIYLVSPAGSKRNYGLAAPFTVRTVAFGAVPVSAKVQLSQNQTAEGLPVPLILKQATEAVRGLPPGTEQRFADAYLTGEIRLGITELTVDGVELGLSGTCQTRLPGQLKMTGKGFSQFYSPEVTEQRPWLTGNYVAEKGGLLEGTISIPAFSGCTTSNGDDVSRLLTATVSAPVNHVQLHVSNPACGSTQAPPGPGGATPDHPNANCDRSKFPPELPYPSETP